MSWDLDFEESDSFLRMTMGDGFGDNIYDFEDDPSKEPPSFFQSGDRGYVNSEPTPALSTHQRVSDKDPKALRDENDELRKTAVSLREKFQQMSSLNQNLKLQLEQCRSTFKSVMFSGIVNGRK